MLRVVDLTHQLNLEPVFHQLRLSGAVAAQRAAFTAELVQGQILGAFEFRDRWMEGSSYALARCARSSPVGEPCDRSAQHRLPRIYT
ncbi:hypothetical protein MPLSOD_140542 [Mesorhizobium sp. SOD10]|nr:hypothetical protein MPLSOD_140542 [Mesorhizobium sp. SOD10]